MRHPRLLLSLLQCMLNIQVQCRTDVDVLFCLLLLTFPFFFLLWLVSILYPLFVLLRTFLKTYMLYAKITMKRKYYPLKCHLSPVFCFLHYKRTLKKKPHTHINRTSDVCLIFSSELISGLFWGVKSTFWDEQTVFFIIRSWLLLGDVWWKHVCGALKVIIGLLVCILLFLPSLSVSVLTWYWKTESPELSVSSQCVLCCAWEPLVHTFTFTQSQACALSVYLSLYLSIDVWLSLDR